LNGARGGWSLHSSMFQLIYASAAARPFDEAELKELLVKSRTRNTQLGVTGLLLHDAGSFLQVLEGERAVVERLYGRIQQDLRHRRIVTLLEHDTRTREFADWSMGFVPLDQHRRDRTLGFSEVLGASFDMPSFLSAREYTSARQMLLAFKDGRLRMHVGS
jgi:hypothetical protein